MKLFSHGLLALALPVLGAALSGCETAPAAGDEAALGEYVYVNNCQPCHGPDGAGNGTLEDEGNEAPGISAMPDWYVAEQVRKFRDGDRGKHFDDIAGLRMRPMARTLQSDAELIAVSKHVAAMQPERRPGHTVEGDVDAGKAKYAACAACHGQAGEGNKTLNAPPLKAMDDWYMLTQLKNFKAGIRGSDPDDVAGMTMRPNVLAMEESDMRDVIAYINTL